MRSSYKTGRFLSMGKGYWHAVFGFLSKKDYIIPLLGEEIPDGVKI